MQQLVSFIKASYPEYKNLKLLNSGAWSTAYRFINDGESLVVRVSNTDLNFKKDKWAYEIAGDLLPIPKVLDIKHSGDKYFCISEFVEGIYFETLDAVSLQSIKNSILNIFQGLLNTEVYNIAGFGSLGSKLEGNNVSWREYILSISQDLDQEDNLIHGWRSNINKSQLFRDQFEELFQEMVSLIGCLPEVKYLIHSDLLNFNVLANKNKVTGVLDWGSSMIGDYLYDLAWFEFYEPWYPEFTKVNLVEEIRLNVFKFDSSQYKRERLLAYKLHIGLGSLAYNSYRNDWKEFKKAYDRTKKILGKGVTTD